MDYKVIQGVQDQKSPIEIGLEQKLSMSVPYTLLRKFSNCEVRPAWCGNFTILLRFKFYVKSNFGKISMMKDAILTVLVTLYFEF